MPTNNPARVGGSANTVFTWAGKVIGFADQVVVEPIQPVAEPEVVQPINARRPLQIAVPAAARNGVITVTLKELYNQTVWRDLAHLADSSDIVDIFLTLANLGPDSGIQVIKYITPHLQWAGGTYWEIFHDCVIANVADGETINISSMTVNKDLTIWYTYSTRHGYNGISQETKFPRTPITSVRT
jgi:hypothetical protein